MQQGSQRVGSHECGPSPCSTRPMGKGSVTFTRVLPSARSGTDTWTQQVAQRGRIIPQNSQAQQPHILPGTFCLTLFIHSSYMLAPRPTSA